MFRVPLSTLQRTMKEGGCGLITPAAKCIAQFISRMREQSMKKGTVTAAWIERLELQEQTKNPHMPRVPRKSWTIYIVMTCNGLLDEKRPHRHTTNFCA